MMKYQGRKAPSSNLRTFTILSMTKLVRSLGLIAQILKFTRMDIYKVTRRRNQRNACLFYLNPSKEASSTRQIFILRVMNHLHPQHGKISLRRVCRGPPRWSRKIESISRSEDTDSRFENKSLASRKQDTGASTASFWVSV